MSEAAETSSTEDKFFGVKTEFKKEDGKVTSYQPEVEVVDDRPPEDRRPPKAADATDEADDSGELENYSDKVRKRINKLKYEQHEERRRREAAERMSQEAVAAAKKLVDENRKYQEIVKNGEAHLINQFKTRTQMEIDAAKRAYTQAFEEGNTQKTLEAQELLSNAQAELRAANQYEHGYQQRVQQGQFAQQQAAQRAQQMAQHRAMQPQAPAIPKPSDEALSWHDKNPWFGSDDHKDMTALAYGIHEKMVTKEGFAVNSKEYYGEIDRRMRDKFPEYFRAGTSRGGSDVVVAPSSRNNGSTPRRVSLTATQVKLAKKLGITPEQYAAQMIKG